MKLWNKGGGGGAILPWCALLITTVFVVVVDQIQKQGGKKRVVFFFLVWALYKAQKLGGKNQVLMCITNYIIFFVCFYFNTAEFLEGGSDWGWKQLQKSDKIFCPRTRNSSYWGAAGVLWF